MSSALTRRSLLSAAVAAPMAEELPTQEAFEATLRWAIPSDGRPDWSGVAKIIVHYADDFVITGKVTV